MNRHGLLRDAAQGSSADLRAGTRRDVWGGNSDVTVGVAFQAAGILMFLVNLVRVRIQSSSAGRDPGSVGRSSGPRPRRTPEYKLPLIPFGTSRQGRLWDLKHPRSRLALRMETGSLMNATSEQAVDRLAVPPAGKVGMLLADHTRNRRSAPSSSLRTSSTWARA